MTTEEAYAMIDAIMQLARSIRACGFTPGIDGTVISELQKLVHAQNDDPEGRGTACEARDALLTLRSAAASLIEDIERDLDALTFDLTAEEARRLSSNTSTPTLSRRAKSRSTPCPAQKSRCSPRAADR